MVTEESKPFVGILYIIIELLTKVLSIKCKTVFADNIININKIKTVALSNQQPLSIAITTG
jgi:hypothetical protein